MTKWQHLQHWYLTMILHWYLYQLQLISSMGYRWDLNRYICTIADHDHIFLALLLRTYPLYFFNSCFLGVEVLRWYVQILAKSGHTSFSISWQNMDLHILFLQFWDYLKGLGSEVWVSIHKHHHFCITINSNENSSIFFFFFIFLQKFYVLRFQEICISNTNFHFLFSWFANKRSNDTSSL